MGEIAILGSGFGLYGYLPALAGFCGQRVVMPVRYRERLEQRSELTEFSDRITWAASEQAALSSASGAVLALCPSMQTRWLECCLSEPKLERIILEKPLAAKPDDAAHWLQRLTDSGKIFRIAYVFRFLEWAEQLRSEIERSDVQRVEIRWRFMAHHFRNDLATWKREPDQGGGVLRFYGIHLIALLAELGYDQVKSSCISGERSQANSRWQAELCGAELPPCVVEVDSADPQSSFHVACETGSKSNYWKLSDPFGHEASAATAGRLDRRVEILARFCKTAWQYSDETTGVYQRTMHLWQSVEACDIEELSVSTV